MSDNRENRRQTRRISSILKNVVSSDDSPTQTFSRRSKRISFSHVNNIKEFAADVNNQTIWGDSYERCHTAKNLSNSGSVSQIPSIDSVVPTTTVDSVAVEPTIDLFADIEDADDTMEVSHGDSQSPTKLFNQTMFIEETVTTSTTNCKHVDMSVVVGNTNKRKTIETISVDTVTTDVMKSVKIRKMNDENLEPDNTILHHLNMSVSSNDRKSVAKSHVNLNTTRIFDGDADLSDVCLPQSAPPTAMGPSKMFDKTSVSTVDFTVDDASIASYVSDTSMPIGHKTHIYSRGDASAGIDQTFAVGNPLQENNVTAWNAAEKLDDSEQHTSEDHEMEDNVPLFQSNFGNSRHRMLEDLTISMDIQFKNHSLSPNALNPDEPAIEDLTILLDTNFKAEVSGENNDSAILSMSKLSGVSESNTRDDVSRPEQLKTQTLSHHEPSTVLPGPENKEKKIPNSLAQLSHTQNAQNLTNLIPKDFSLDPVADEIGVACRDRVLPLTPDLGSLLGSANGKLTKHNFLDYSTSHDQVPGTDFSFAYSEPLSSTRFAPNNKFPLNFSNSETNNRANCSSVTFNDCPTPTTRQSQDLRSAASLQNNTDELCNLEPDQLKKMSEMKKLFLSLSQDASNDMLTETKIDLVSISNTGSINDESKEPASEESASTNKPTKQNLPSNEPVTNATDRPSNYEEMASKEAVNQNVAAGRSAEMQTDNYKEPRCRKCLNCRRSIDGTNATFLGMSQLNQRPKLDFSMYDQFKGLPTLRDVVAAQKKREAARELEKELLIDQNVETPDVRLLWLNKNGNENPVEPQPVYVPEPLVCFPLRMNIQYLMRNKMRTEYSQWKYYDNFFHIGAIALRNNEIPSIRIHIKFDLNAQTKAEELNMPLLFNRVFIEQCPTYLNRISAGNLLKHNQAFALLPTNLTSLLSNSENIYRGLDEIQTRFRSVVVKVNEIDALTVKHDALMSMEDDGTCHIERTFFDIQKKLAQVVRIDFDKIDTVGPRNVFFQPDCRTTDAFKALPTGLPFLRSFLRDPMSYIVPFSDA